nr:RdgB/HAM1 family non-canonical purine NTP pyrophosphatase [Pararhodobacter sp. SW119]
MEGRKLVVATHNAGKMAEMRALFGPYNLGLVSAAELELPEPEETEANFLGNARIKANAAARATGLVALADDSGLEIDALDGAPGVYTANWAEVGGKRDFGHAMRRTHEELSRRGAAEPWRARFRCTLVLAWPDGHEEAFEGSVDGSLVWPIRGKEGHGYDPMFLPDGSALTFAEMPETEKNRISHRSRAFAGLIHACFT